MRYFDSTASQQRVKSIAKNIVLFIGDGMGISTITAARILKGQLEAQSRNDWSHQEKEAHFKTAEDGQLSFETFDYVALSKVSECRLYTVESI